MIANPDNLKRTNQNPVLPNMNIRIHLVALVLAFVFTSQSVGQITQSFTEPYDQRELAVAQNQRLTFVAVKAGSTVNLGDLLAELEVEPLKQQLRLLELRAKSKAGFNAAQARVSIRKRKLDALNEIAVDGFANRSEILNAELEYAEAEAERDLAKLQIDESQIDVTRIKAEIRQKQIFSPFKGVIAEVFFKPGEVVGAGDSRFATIVQLERLKVRFYLGLSTINKLKVGDSVDLVLNQATPVVGKIEFISPITSPDSSTARVDVVIENQDHSIRSGIPCSWGNPKSKQTSLDVAVNHDQRGAPKQ